MRLLLLGGPTFLGRAVLEAALAAGHETTMFNRGRSDASAFPGVERLTGDRDGALDALRGRAWDAVVDTCGYVPRIVRQSAALLEGAVGRYVFVSSVSVYASFARPVDESSPVAALADPASEDVAADYGALKAACEAVVEERFPGRALHVRAGLVAGPHDPTGRFTYWPHRLARGGDVLVPGPLDRPVAFVDVRDLGEWIVACAVRGTAGAVNALHRHRLLDVLEACRAVTGSDAALVPADDDLLREAGVGEWLELPLWIDRGSPGTACFMDVDASRALDAGLRCRPLAETARGALDLAAPVPGVGLAPDRERALVARARARARGDRPARGL